MAMKKIGIIILVLIFHEIQAFAQAASESHRYNKNGSVVWISLNNGAVLGKGLLWKVTSDTLEFVSPGEKSKYYKEVPVLKIHYSDIKELKTTPRAAIKKGMLTGAAIGFATGLVVGLATTENPDPYTIKETTPELCFLIFCSPAKTYDVTIDEPRDAGTVIAKTLILTITGTIVGIIKGSSEAIEGKIEGSQEKYQALVPELKKQAFWSPADLQSKK